MLKKIISNPFIYVYVLIGAEFMFMISPFVLYYYAIYGLVLKNLFISPLTCWLTGFFLPHIVLINNPFFVILSFAGPVLIVMGLLIFLVCAVEVYFVKFKGGNKIITKGAYSFFPHPQYLGLAISGLGFLLIWPRFLILIAYITMLFMYYLLAKDEEKKMEEEFGDAYKNYKLRVPNLLPSLKLPIFFAYIMVLIVSVGIGFVLREYTKSQLPVAYFKNIVIVPLFPEDKNIAREAIEKILADEKLVPYVSGDNLKEQPTFIAYIMPVYAAGSGEKYIGDNYSDKPDGADKKSDLKSNFIFRIRNLHDMFILGPLSRLNTHKIPAMRRIVFYRVVDRKHKYVSPRDVFKITAERIPSAFIEIDIKEWKVFPLPEIPAWRKFILPMPSF